MCYNELVCDESSDEIDGELERDPDPPAADVHEHATGMPVMSDVHAGTEQSWPGMGTLGRSGACHWPDTLSKRADRPSAHTIETVTTARSLWRL